MKIAPVDGKLLDIMSEEDMIDKWSHLTPSITANSAVEIQNGDKTYLLPFRGKTDDRPGIYLDGPICFQKFPEENEDDLYNAEKLKVVDFSASKNVSDFLSKNKQVRDMETDILTDVDSIFCPTISNNDSPEMAAFKEAIIAKHIDINKYASRFGENFLNDKRILRTNNITMNKLVSMCKKLDIEAELILRDSKTCQANKMGDGKEIRVILTGGENSND